MKRSENGQALIDFLLLLVVLIGIPLGLLFRYNVQLRNVSVRAVRGMGMMIRSWRGSPRRPAAKPAEKAKPATPAAKPAEKDKAPAAAPAEKAKPATPAAKPAEKDNAPAAAPAAPAR